MRFLLPSDRPVTKAESDWKKQNASSNQYPSFQVNSRELSKELIHLRTLTNWHAIGESVTTQSCAKAGRLRNSSNWEFNVRTRDTDAQEPYHDINPL
jgi:hypothetical protein